MPPALTIPLMSPFPYHQPGAARALQWFKADLHLHTAEDPFDEVNYTALELVERAHTLGFRVLAVTLHDKVIDDHRAFDRARELGLLLIPAVERRIEGADVVLLNVTPDQSDALRSFEDLRQLRAGRGGSLLVLAPHPYYHLGGSIGGRIDHHLDCFDAIEHCHFHVPLLNPNRPARRLAHRHNKPLLATSDSHRKQFFGRHYSYLGLKAETDAVPTVEAVFDAIRSHRIRRVAPTGGLLRLIGLLFFIFVTHPVLVRLPGSKRTRSRARQHSSPEPVEYPSANERAVI